VSDPAATLAAIGSARVIVVIRAEGPGTALRTAEALLEGGVRAIELTFTTPGVKGALVELVERHPAVLVGAGTITRPEQAAAAASAGAGFLASPAAPPSLVTAMAATGLPTIAGCLTPTEILAAVDAGAHAIKIFPAAAVGPAYLTALRGPFPSLRFIPTGGIQPADVPTWFRAGAFAVGIGGALARAVHDDEGHRAVVQAARALSSQLMVDLGRA
jgi:2-dehydro-3-deoxyphosphogluconate aldolase / (4S)-4-hydroxy-2-oxoglutarate aldolase